MVEEQLRASKEEMERCLSEYDELFRTIQRLSEELTVQVATNTALQVSTFYGYTRILGMPYPVGVP